jgi:hypothetical protein
MTPRSVLGTRLWRQPLGMEPATPPLPANARGRPASRHAQQERTAFAVRPTQQSSQTIAGPLLVHQSGSRACETWLDVDNLPENVAWFVEQLTSSGFEETRREGGTMDSGRIVFRREPVEVRLVKDRSQWSVDLIADGWRERDRVGSRCSTASRSTSCSRSCLVAIVSARTSPAGPPRPSRLEMHGERLRLLPEVPNAMKPAWFELRRVIARSMAAAPVYSIARRHARSCGIGGPTPTSTATRT